MTTVSSQDDEIVREFVVEGHENLDRLERELVAYEREGATPDRIASLFRTVHTIKGTSGFFGFARVQRLTHAAEHVLAKVRDGERALTPAVVTALLDVVDESRMLLASIEAVGAEDERDCDPLIATLCALADGEPMTAEAPLAEADLTEAPVNEAHVESTMRVDIAVVDRLVDLAGELVLARNQIARLTAARRDPALTAATQRLDAVASVLQDCVMRTRMQPIGSVWAKLPRLVRDLASELGKSVRLELCGEDTGLDRAVLETVRDPLVHLVRNAIDHGIESPDRREEAGKPVEAVVELRASHEAGRVTIELRDDGAGIDPARAREKAIERGMITAEAAARLSDVDAIQLVFAPGFSTAAKVTRVSGRGVGMDVVKTNVDAIGGTVDVVSCVGAGTCVRIELPLTVAIIPALIVHVDRARYAIPLAKIVELVRAEASSPAFERVLAAPVFRLRGSVLPIVDLGRMFGATAGTHERDKITLVIVQDGDRRIAFVVDAVADTEQVVVKPCGALLDRLAMYSGATILGDGEIALILDVRGVTRRAGLGWSRAAERAAMLIGGDAASGLTGPAAAATIERPAWLVATSSTGRRVTLPLAEVTRLEELAPTSIERAGDREVVQYEGRLLPVFRIDGADEPGEQLTLVVHTSRVGVIVHAIAEVVEQAVTVDRSTAGPGRFGSAIVGGRVADVLDVATLGARHAA